MINGVRISAAFEAHHALLQALFGDGKPYEYILKDEGININDPRLMTWWDEAGHGINASENNTVIQKYIDDVSDNADDVINKVREMMSEYGFEVRF
jgi:hypothetical protein